MHSITDHSFLTNVVWPPLPCYLFFFNFSLKYFRNTYLPPCFFPSLCSINKFSNCSDYDCEYDSRMHASLKKKKNKNKNLHPFRSKIRHNAEPTTLISKALWDVQMSSWEPAQKMPSTPCLSPRNADLFSTFLLFSYWFNCQNRTRLSPILSLQIQFS